MSQTAGDPVPERPRPVLPEGEAPAGLWDGLAVLVEAEGFAILRVEHEGMIGGANGLTDYAARTVAVRANMDPAAQAKTLAHELAQVKLHGPDHPDATGHRGIGEVEAESVVLMIGAAHGGHQPLHDRLRLGIRGSCPDSHVRGWVRSCSPRRGWRWNAVWEKTRTR